MSQSHFTLSFPLKSPADAKAIAEELPLLMPGFFETEDTIGTIHYSRFTVLSEKTLLFLGDFDGEFTQLMTDFATHAAPVFDAIFDHVGGPPSMPVSDHADAFVEWMAEHLVHPLNLYTAYPDVTVKEVKAWAAAADVTGAGELHPFLVIIPGKSWLAYQERMRVIGMKVGYTDRRQTAILGTASVPHLRRQVYPPAGAANSLRACPVATSKSIQSQTWGLRSEAPRSSLPLVAADRGGPL